MGLFDFSGTSTSGGGGGGGGGSYWFGPASKTNGYLVRPARSTSSRQHSERHRSQSHGHSQSHGQSHGHSRARSPTPSWSAWLPGQGRQHQHHRATHYGSTAGGRRRRPRDGYIAYLVEQLRVLSRRLVRFARRNPVKLVLMLLSPLLAGGLLAGLARRFGIPMPAALTALTSLGQQWTAGRRAGPASASAFGSDGYYGSTGYGRTSRGVGGGGGGGGIGSALGGLGALSDGLGALGGIGALGSVAGLFKLASAFV